ncbi:hypothetical protein [Pyxidicoccus xibeiensis]|uniref:hypothetical protein n=1 Tax=Pyxidicoccus xibeiensis TaxID=2906759 RepID=UPI0020A76409|nr:hypothetical protein [Pyxidicoccus xibeiensis]MCP3141259.1 hypothetical protein [Pyxidicoccus xibeiensis]
MSPTEPRPLLDALRAGTPLPTFPADAVEAARALARDVGAATPAAVEALPEALAAAVLEAAVVDGVPALAEALSGSAVKPLAKAAKKALYRLRSRGVAVAEAPRPAAAATPEPARAAASAPEALPAMASTITSAGERALVLGRVLRGGGVEMVQALVSDVEGVVELRLGEKSRGNWRRILREALERGGAVELPQHEAAALLAEAAGTNLRARTPFPPDLDVALRHFGVQAQVEPTVLPPPEPEDVRRALEGDRLHETPELATWLPPEADVKRLLQKLDEVMHSPLALSDVQRQEQLQAAVRAVAREVFASEARPRYALRLWRMADFFERTARPHEADLARGEARRLFHGADEPFSRFAERLFEKVLALVAAAGARAGAAQAAATPPAGNAEAPAAAAPAPSQERRSPGGLILP